jgi:hypothetical protein
MGFADTIIALEGGKISQIGSPQSLLTYDGYVTKLGLTLPDEDLIAREHAEDTEISRIKSTIAESIISVSDTMDDSGTTPDIRRKNGDWSVYRYYFASSGFAVVLMFLISMAIWIFCTEFASKCDQRSAQAQNETNTFENSGVA